MELDYSKLGFKCWIEIHQQLDTSKLFCPCPSTIREDDPHLTVERRMRPVAGELGDVDPAALHEFLLGRSLVYEAYKDTTCLVELDEEPPHPINTEAVEIALTVALLLSAKPVHEAWVMRKTVIDGSNTSGFQRTMLLATDGVLETSEGDVRIPTVCLEEDAARKIKEEGGVTTYRLDRLGIPLVEIATGPDIKSPSHAREVAEKIGLILRATGRVKRGLGTIRQDLNVSIAGGERIEAKGVQDLSLIPKVVEGEVGRQLMLIEVKKELEKRGALGQKPAEPANMTVVFAKTSSTVVKKSLESGGVVLGVKLPGFSGLLKNKLGPELAQYAKAYSTAKGIFHSDELPAYGVTDAEVKEVSKKLGLSDGDAFALVCESGDEARKAIEGVLKRLEYFHKGVAVPDETRRALADGRTEFMRPLPGSARMYPETDEVPVLTGELVGKISGNLPKLPQEVAREYEERGLSGELASQLARSNMKRMFEDLSGRHPKVSPTLIAHTILSTPKEIQKRYNTDASSLSERHFSEAFELLSENRISKDALVEILSEVAKSPNKSVETIVTEKGLARMSDKELNEVVKSVIKKHKGEPKNKIVGLVMAEIGRAHV